MEGQRGAASPALLWSSGHSPRSALSPNSRRAAPPQNARVPGHGISSGTLCNRRKKYCDLDVKRDRGEQSLDLRAMKNVVPKKRGQPRVPPTTARYLRDATGVTLKGGPAEDDAIRIGCSVLRSVVNCVDEPNLHVLGR